MGRAVPCEWTSAALVQRLSWQRWPPAPLCCDVPTPALLPAGTQGFSCRRPQIHWTAQTGSSLFSTRKKELTCKEGNSYQLVLSWLGLIVSKAWGSFEMKYVSANLEDGRCIVKDCRRTGRSDFSLVFLCILYASILLSVQRCICHMYFHMDERLAWSITTAVSRKQSSSTNNGKYSGHH